MVAVAGGGGGIAVVGIVAGGGCEFPSGVVAGTAPAAASGGGKVVTGLVMGCGPGMVPAGGGGGTEAVGIAGKVPAGMAGIMPPGLVEGTVTIVGKGLAGGTVGNKSSTRNRALGFFLALKEKPNRSPEETVRSQRRSPSSRMHLEAASTISAKWVFWGKGREGRKEEECWYVKRRRRRDCF